jgi:hypothetical protein
MEVVLGLVPVATLHWNVYLQLCNFAQGISGNCFGIMDELQVAAQELLRPFHRRERLFMSDFVSGVPRSS